MDETQVGAPNTQQSSLQDFIFRIYLLKRIIVTCQARHESKTPISKLSDVRVLDFNVYKPYLLFWALLDTIINIHFKVGSSSST